MAANLNLNLSELYEFEDLTRHFQMQRTYSAMAAGVNYSSTTLTAFMDSEIPLSNLIERALMKLRINVVPYTVDANGVSLAKHSACPFRLAYDIVENGAHIASVITTIDDKKSHEYILKERSSADPDSLNEVNICIYGRPDLVAELSKAIKKELTSLTSSLKRSVIRWRYATNYGPEVALISLKKDWTIHQEAYPWLKVPLNQYYADYLASSASILVCFGPPGTGKTTFIRDLICETGLNALVSYDPAVLTSDEMFTFFMQSPAYDVLIVEDADELLTADRESNNKLISKLLNTSDGLLRLPKKKIILSTNLENVVHIDEALTRPGRCFDMLNFRRLTHLEALALAVKTGKTLAASGEFSLAEMYMSKPTLKPKLGFT